MRYEPERVKEGVYRVVRKDYNILTEEAILFIKSDCMKNTLKRSRINFHGSDDDSVHEMIIALGRDTHIRIHKHIAKSESFNIIEGKLAIVLFLDDDLKEREVVILEHNNSPYYRLNASVFHLVLPLTEIVVLLEVTNGPFDATLTEFVKGHLAGTERDMIEYYRQTLCVNKDENRERIQKSL